MKPVAGSLAVLSTVTILVSCVSQTVVQYRNTDLADVPAMGASAVCIPVVSVKTDYRDNTQVKPDTVFSDTFLIEAANALFQFETAKRFNLAAYEGTDFEPTTVKPRPTSSVLAKDTANPQAMSEAVQKAAKAAGAAFVVVPYACTIEYAVNQKESWREKRGPSYSKPVAAHAVVKLHAQLWDAQGRLVSERIGTAVAGKPFLYDLVNRKKKKPVQEEDVLKSAQRLYGSPILKALCKAAEMALRAR